MALNWINVEDFSFNCLLLLERFQIRLLCGNDSESMKAALAVALKAHPDIAWYFAHRCPECAEKLERIVASASEGAAGDEIRKAELQVLASIEDFVLYTRPEWMDSHCDFIYAWDEQRLFELADFSGKTVLDVGAGSGRLTFAAAKTAKGVYAVEPVATLREYLKDKCKAEHIMNVRVADGMADALPYPDGTFDIVMSGHVVGDDFDAEIAELTRVCKDGGLLIDCPGEETRKFAPGGELAKRGWEQFHYVSSLGGDVYRYRKRVQK